MSKRCPGALRSMCRGLCSSVPTINKDIHRVITKQIRTFSGLSVVLVSEYDPGAGYKKSTSMNMVRFGVVLWISAHLNISASQHL